VLYTLKMEAGGKVDKKQLLLLELLSPDYLMLEVPSELLPASATLACDDPAVFISPSTLEFKSPSAEVSVRLLARPQSSLSLAIRFSFGQSLLVPVYFSQLPAAKLYSAGANDNCQLGFQNTSPDIEVESSPMKCTSIPLEVSYQGTFTTLSAGEKHVLAVTKDGQVVVWGSNESGQLCIDEVQSSTSVPRPVAGLERVWQVACGQTHSVILTYENKVYSCGCGQEGRLGHGSEEPLRQPMVIKELLGYRLAKVAAGYSTSFFLDIEGKLLSCGNYSLGALGHSHSQSLPTLIPDLPPIHQVSSGKAHTGCVDFDGTVHLFGDPSDGRLGSPNPRSEVPAAGLGNERARAVYCGGAHTHILTESLEVYSFGCNKKGQLGLTRSDFQ